MLSARWRRRPFCLQRNTTSRGNPKEREKEREGGDGKFLSRRNTEGKSVPRLARKRLKERRVDEIVAGAGRPCEIIFSADRRNFYPISAAASGIKRFRGQVSLWGFGKCSGSKQDMLPGKLHLSLSFN